MDTMMTKSKQKKYFKTTPIALALIVSGHTAAPLAIEFNWGDIEGTFNSQLSVGSSWRVEDADVKNLGTGNANAKGLTGAAGNTPTGDDGNLNYDKGDAFTQTIKGIHDLGLTYENDDGNTSRNGAEDTSDSNMVHKAPMADLQSNDYIDDDGFDNETNESNDGKDIRCDDDSGHDKREPTRKF